MIFQAMHHSINKSSIQAPEKRMMKHEIRQHRAHKQEGKAIFLEAYKAGV